jgi:hypothetical protein
MAQCQQCGKALWLAARRGRGRRCSSQPKRALVDGARAARQWQAGGRLRPASPAAWRSVYDDVEVRSSFLPVDVVGRRGRAEPKRDVAVAVDGGIRPINNPFRLAIGAGGDLVSLLVPPDSLRGRNRIEVLAIR